MILTDHPFYFTHESAKEDTMLVLVLMLLLLLTILHFMAGGRRRQVGAPYDPARPRGVGHGEIPDSPARRTPYGHTSGFR